MAIETTAVRDPDLRTGLHREPVRGAGSLGPEPALVEALEKLAVELDQMATDRQKWADHPDIGSNKPRFHEHLRGKRYGYSHAAQLIRSALAKARAAEKAAAENISRT